MTAPVVVLGATGYTGRLIAAHLADAGVPLVLAGRRESALAELGAALGVQALRVVDVTSPTDLDAALAGAGAVVTSVGPFLALGLPVAEAAVRAGVHYVDTTAEQAFIDRLYGRLHGAAADAGVALLTGHAADFAFAYCGAAILEARFGPLERVDTFHDLGDFRPSRGTARSMVGMLSEPTFAWRDAARAPVAGRWTPWRVALPGYDAPVWTAPFAGGDVALLPRELPGLTTCTSSLVLPPRGARGVAAAVAATPALSGLFRPGLVDRLQRLIDRRLPDPTPEVRAATPWVVTVRGERGGRAWCCRMTGSSTYGDSAHVAALAATWLARGEGRAAGVVTTGRAFDAAAFLDALGPYGIRWSVLDQPSRSST